MNIQSYMQPIISSYYENRAKKLHKMVDKVLNNLHFIEVDKEDFYSLADEIFVMEVIPNYDPEKQFEGFLYSTLYKKFCTEMTRNKRYKRCTKIKIKKYDEYGNVTTETIVVPDERFDAPIDEEDNLTFGDMIADSKSVESQIFEKEDREDWHVEVKEYLNSLSPLQRKIAFLLSDNFTPEEICDELHITMGHYANSVKRMFADDKVKVLRPLVEKGRM